MGKSTIIYVIGLSLIIGLALTNVNRSSLDSMDTYSTYFGRTMAHNIALAAANLATNRVLFTPGYNTPFSGSFSGGSYDVAFADTGSGEAYRKFMSVTSAYNAGGETIRDTVRAVFGRYSFSRYAWFTDMERNGYRRPNGTGGPYHGQSDWKITGDSVFGYAHTNSKFNLAGRPYFGKKVTATNAPTTANLAGVYNPTFMEGYEWGVSVARPTGSIATLKANANIGNPLAGYFNGNDVGMRFMDTDVRVRVPYNTGALVDTVMRIADLSSTGLTGILNGDLHISGRYQGQLSVAAFTGTGATANKGNVWIDGDVIAHDNPQTNPASTDKLGIIAERMAYITEDHHRNASSQVNIQAAIYTHNGEFTAEDFWTIPISGRVNLYGSICQATAGSLGVFNHGHGLLHGFFYSIRHDTRFLVMGPPHFPYSTKYRLVAWWEN